MHRKGSGWNVARIIIGLVVAVAVVVVARIGLGQTTMLMISPSFSGGTQQVARAAPVSPEPFTGQTTYPSQATWDWVMSDEHEGASTVREGAACAKCHKDQSAQSGFWPTWADPPTDHAISYQNFGCQTCHTMIGPTNQVSATNSVTKSTSAAR